MSIADMRRQYSQGHLTDNDLTDHPVDLFKQWLGAAIDAGIPDPTAMTVATVDAEGQLTCLRASGKLVNLTARRATSTGQTSTDGATCAF